MSKLQEALSRVKPPKVSVKELQGQTYQAQRVQVKGVNTENNVGKLLQLGSIGTKAYGSYVEAREQKGHQRKNEILLKNLKPEEIKAMRDDGILLYQDDPYAMRALEREIGRQEAYNADAVVVNKIKAGDFKSRQEMEEFRAEQVKSAQTKMAEAYGISPDSSYYREGMQKDIVDRNMAVYNAQAVKTDEANRNKTRLVVENNLQAIIKHSPNKAEGVIKYLNDARDQGMLNEQEFSVQFQKAASNIAEQGSVDEMEKLLDTTVNFQGVDTTFGAMLGDAQGNQFMLQAGTKAYTNNQTEMIDFERSINKISNSDVSTIQGANMARDELNKQWKRVYEMNQNHPTWTQQKEALLRAEAVLNDNIAKANKANHKKLKDKYQSDIRYKVIDQRVEAALKGEGVPLSLDSFLETSQTGKFTTNDYANFYQNKMQEVMSDDTLTDSQKKTKVMSLGNVMKDADKAGFGAWYQAQMGTIQKELDAVGFAVSAGIDVPDTPTFNSYGEMYAQNPKLFMSTFGDDAQMALDLATAKSLNIDYATYSKGVKTIHKMDETDRRQFGQEWAAQVDKVGGILKKLTPQQREVYRGWAASANGIGFNSAVARITEHAEANFIDIGSSSITGIGDVSVGTVKRSILMIKPDDPDSANEGAKALSKYMQKTFGNQFNRTQAYSIGDTIIIMNPNGAREIIDRQRFLELYKQYK